MSTIPAIAEVVLGYLVGQYIVRKENLWNGHCGLFIAAVAMLVTGFCWYGSPDQ